MDDREKQLEVAAELRAQLASSPDEETKRRLRDDIAEYEGRSLTGDAHQRADGGDTSP